MSKSNVTLDIVKKEADKRGFIVKSLEYVNNNTKMEFYHKDCGYLFLKTWAGFYNGKQGCPKCNKRAKPTIDDCFQYASDRGYNLLDTLYINSKTKMTFVHNECQNEFGMLWVNFYNNEQGCPKCFGANSPSLREIGDFAEKRGYHLLSDYYKNNQTKIELKHVLCGSVFEISWANFRRGNGCHKCGGSEKLTIEHCEDFSRNKGYELLSKTYSNSRTKMKFRHLDCGYVFMMKWDNFISQNCPKCAGKVVTMKDCSKFAKKRGYSVVSKLFLGAKIKMKFKHDFCETVFETTWDNFRSKNTGCPVCSNQKSSVEVEIEKILKKFKLRSGKDYISEARFDDCKHISNLYFDFYFPNRNIVLEYDGQQHYKPVRFGGISQEKAEENFNSQKMRDKIKKEYCKNNKIKLIRIPYWKKEEIEKILVKELNLKY